MFHVCWKLCALGGRWFPRSSAKGDHHICCYFHLHGFLAVILGKPKWDEAKQSFGMTVGSCEKLVEVLNEFLDTRELDHSDRMKERMSRGRRTKELCRGDARNPRESIEHDVYVLQGLLASVTYNPRVRDEAICNIEKCVPRIFRRAVHRPGGCLKKSLEIISTMSGICESKTPEKNYRRTKSTTCQPSTIARIMGTALVCMVCVHIPGAKRRCMERTMRTLRCGTQRHRLGCQTITVRLPRQCRCSV